MPGLELAPHAIRLLADGDPVALEQLAAASGRSVKGVEAALGEQTGAERDDQGHLVGLGLTLRPTPPWSTGAPCLRGARATHSRFPSSSAGPGAIASTCPQTGHAIRIDLTPDTVERLDPPDALVSAVRPTGMTDGRSSVCRHGLQLASRCQALGRRAPRRRGVRGSGCFRLDRDVIKKLGWDAPREQHD